MDSGVCDTVCDFVTIVIDRVTTSRLRCSAWQISNQMKSLNSALSHCPCVNLNHSLLCRFAVWISNSSKIIGSSPYIQYTEYRSKHLQKVPRKWLIQIGLKTKRTAQKGQCIIRVKVTVTLNCLAYSRIEDVAEHRHANFGIHSTKRLLAKTQCKFCTMTMVDLDWGIILGVVYTRVGHKGDRQRWQSIF